MQACAPLALIVLSGTYTNRPKSLTDLYTPSLVSARRRYHRIPSMHSSAFSSISAACRHQCNSKILGRLLTFYRRMLILCLRIDPFLPSPTSCLDGCFLCIDWGHLQVYTSPVLIRFRNVHLLPPHCSRVTLTERLSNAFATPLQRPPTAPQISCNTSQRQRKCPSHL